jgi:hypothetical protein
VTNDGSRIGFKTWALTSHGRLTDPAAFTNVMCHILRIVDFAATLLDALSEQLAGHPDPISHLAHRSFPGAA